jgi:hypothetical protein
MIGFEVVGAFATILSVLQTWRASRRGKRNLKHQAIRDLSDAVAATRVAMAGKGRRRRSPNVVNAWEKASVALAEAKEPVLSRLCQIKSLYWFEPSRWSRAEVRAAGIQLTGIEKELGRLLGSLSDAGPPKKLASKHVRSPTRH